MSNVIAGTLNTSSPGVVAYGWTSGVGFGAKYSDPATTPNPVGGYGVAFTPSNDALAAGSGTSPYIMVYPFSVVSGFGVKYSDPATLPTNSGLAVTFSPTGQDVILGQYGTWGVGDNQQAAYPWTSGVGFGAKYPNPATVPDEGARGVSFSPTGADVVFAIYDNHLIANHPPAVGYPWTHGVGYGTRYVNPSTRPQWAGTPVTFHPTGVDVGIGLASNVVVYKWAHGSGLGSAYSNPFTIPNNTTYGMSFSPSGLELALTNISGSFVYAFHWVAGSGFGSSFSSPSTPIPNAGAGLAFNQVGGVDIAVGYFQAPWISVYPWLPGFGAKYADPGTAIPATMFRIAFSGEGATVHIIPVSDSAFVGELIQIRIPVLSKSVADNVSVNSSSSLFIPVANFSISDTAVVGEFVKLDVLIRVFVSELLVVGESSSLLRAFSPSVFEAVGIGDTASVYIPYLVALGAESVGLNDSPIAHFPILGNLLVVDDVQATEALVLNLFLMPNVADSAVVADSVPVIFTPFLRLFLAEAVAVDDPIRIRRIRDFRDRFTELHRLRYLVQGQGSHFFTVNAALDSLDDLLAQALPWEEVIVSARTMVARHGYIANSDLISVTLVLPQDSQVGDMIEILGRGAGGWVIAQNDGQRIQVGHRSTSLGTDGSLASRYAHDAVSLRCITKDLEWEVLTLS